jgi:hypothetical protein
MNFLLINLTLDPFVMAKNVLSTIPRIMDHFVNMAQNLLFEMRVVLNYIPGIWTVMLHQRYVKVLDVYCTSLIFETRNFIE